MSLVIISSDRFGEHQMPPGHPERVARAAVMDAVASRARMRGLEVTAPHPATTAQLARVHAPEYIGMIAETAGRAVALDPDTYTSAESHGVALLAAGAAVDAVERLFRREDGSGRSEARSLGDEVGQEERGEGAGLRAVLAMVRPPGHHAEQSRAMGFCLFNNVAVAAAHAHSLGARRVAIVDYDVHHGNGTQHIFEHDSHTLYMSLHQFPFYPGTGAADEIGREAGAGFTVNLPLEAGAADEDYRIAFSEIVVPILRQYDPDLLIVSAGFDAHERDPLAGMRLTSGAFGMMTASLRGIAEECCNGRLILVTEGGYDLQALDTSLEAVIETLAVPARAAEGLPPPLNGAARRGLAAVDAARRALSRYWKFA